MGDTDTKVPTLKELFDASIAAGDKWRELRSMPADKQGESYAADVRSATAEVEIADRTYSQAERRATFEMLQAATAAANAGQGPGAATGDGKKREPRSLGDAVVLAEQYKDFSEKRAYNMSVEVRDIFPPIGLPVDQTTGPGLFVPRGTPFLPTQAIDRMRLFVRDLISGGQTTLENIPYIRENSPDPTGASGAQMVAAGTLKPEVTMNFAPDQATVQKIAAWLSATYEILQDAPTLRSYIDARLAYMLKVREEMQLLNGTGTAPQLKGIFTYSANQTAIDAGTDALTAVATMAGKIEQVDGVADGVAMNPQDFWAIASRRASGDGHYDVNPFTSPDNLNLWGFTTVRTRSVPQGTIDVGAWKMGAQLFDREGIQIRLGDQHADYFTSNKVAILAEERLTVATYRPDWFGPVTGVNTTEPV